MVILLKGLGLPGLFTWGIVGAVAFVLLCVGGFVVSRVKIAPQTHALVIAGRRGSTGTKVVLPGGRTFVTPIVESSSLILLGQINVPLQVSGVDSNKVPVDVEGVAMVKVRQDEQSIRDAAERFGSYKNFSEAIARNLQQVLTGSLRSAVAGMTVEELLVNREVLATKVREATEAEVAVMGIAVDSLQILDISDRNGYIKALGAKESEKVFAEARIAKADNDKIANDSEVSSEQAIAERERDLEIRKAALKEETDRAQAIADAASKLAKAEQDRKIAQLEQETAKEQATLRERQLDIDVRKPADAARYKMETEAEANANAKRISVEAESQALLKIGEAEAEAKKLAAIAEAETIEKTGVAEALAMEKKANAYERYNQAAVLELVIERMPEIAKALAEPMGNIDNLTVVSSEGAGAIPKTVANNFSQLDKIMESVSGVSLSNIVQNFTKDKTLGAVSNVVKDV